MYETIDLLQQTTDYYYIDYIPYNTDDPNFLGEYPKVCVNLQTDVR